MKFKNSNDKKVCDLEERTAGFGEVIIDFVKIIGRMKSARFCH
jgi:hypothetical protein